MIREMNRGSENPIKFSQVGMSLANPRGESVGETLRSDRGSPQIVGSTSAPQLHCQTDETERQHEQEQSGHKQVEDHRIFSVHADNQPDWTTGAVVSPAHSPIPSETNIC